MCHGNVARNAGYVAAAVGINVQMIVSPARPGVAIIHFFQVNTVAVKMNNLEAIGGRRGLRRTERRFIAAAS